MQTRTSTRTRLSALVAVGALGLGLAACSGDDSDTSSATTAAPAASMAPSSTTTMTGDDSAMAALSEENFGPGCAAVPSSGAGSFDGMAADPAATAASNNPVLSTLVAAVGAAGLGDTLNGPGPFTIFAPANDAFAKIDEATLDTVLADPQGQLTEILTYHVVAGESLDAAELAEEGTVQTVNGGELTISERGGTIEVNGTSSVVCGNVKTANATVHIIDAVLMPS